MDILKLHQAIAKVAPIEGVSDNGDGSFRIDFLPAVTDEERNAAQTVVDNWTDPPDPQWLKFLAEFQAPGSNTLYASVVEKVAAANFATQDHWQNFKRVVQAHDIGSLPGAIAYLAQLLTNAGQALSDDDINGWNALMDSYDFPDDCKLNNADTNPSD